MFKFLFHEEKKLLLPKFYCAAIFISVLIQGCNQYKDNNVNQDNKVELKAGCSGKNCGIDGNNYTGKGLGVWSYENISDSTKLLKIAISGLQNNQVTLVFSNLSDKQQTLQKNLKSLGNKVKPEFSINTTDPIPTDLQNSPQAPLEKQTWKVPQIEVQNVNPTFLEFPSTLRSQTTIGEFTYKIWVANEEWTSHMQESFPYLASGLFGTPSYPGLLKQYLTDYNTQPWGNYPSTEENNLLISPNLREINIVIAPTGKTFGLQFFDNSQLHKTSKTNPNSNEALIVFADSSLFSCRKVPEGLCIQKESRDQLFNILNTFTHELNHLISFYQRGVLLGSKKRFETWLEEAIASSHGYIVASSRFPNTSPLFVEFTSWLSGNYSCTLNSNEGAPGNQITNKNCSQNYYKSGQAFLVFLVHQYGTGIYRELLKAKGTGIDALDEAIQAMGGKGFKDAFRRWGSMLALPNANSLPEGYGYPGRKIGEYTVPALDGKNFTNLRLLNDTLPDIIEPYSHLPLVEAKLSGTYTKELQIPPGVSLTVYVQ